MTVYTVPNFQLGGIIVPIHAIWELSQDYSPVGGFTLLRMLDGAGVKQQHWEKIATTVTGSGYIPAGLDSLDYKTPLLMRCATKRGVSSIAPTTILVPQARRTDVDHEVIGFAIVDGNDAQWEETPIIGTTPSVARPGFDEIDLTAVGGAKAYRINYYPEITVFAEHPVQDGNPHQDDQSWTLTAEQV